MTEYITVKLTKDQITAIIKLCYKTYLDNEVANPAFYNRIAIKLSNTKM